MTERTHRKPFAFALSRRGRRILLAVAAAVALVAALAIYDFLRINLWIDRDAGRFDTYPVILIRQREPVNFASDGSVGKINLMLIAEMSRGRRNVVSLARSEIKHNLLHTRAYTKVFLETAAPDNPDLKSRLVVLCEFQRTGSGWKLDKAVEKTLE